MSDTTTKPGAGNYGEVDFGQTGLETGVDAGVVQGEARAERGDKRVSYGSLTQQRRIALVGRLLLVLLIMLYVLFPIYFIVVASVDPTNSLAQQNLVPTNVTWENYRNLLSGETVPYRMWMWNSLKISTVTAVLGVVLTTIAAFAFSRFRFRGRQSLLQSILLIQVFPNFLNMVAIFLLLQQLGRYELTSWLGLNQHGGLILVYLGGVLGINTWLMKGYFDSVPRDLDEAAIIDGASYYQTFSQVILPLVRPIIVVVGILAFIGTYSEYLLARVLLQEPEQYTLAVGLSLFISDQFSQRWGEFAAGAVIGALPIVIIFLLLQNQIVNGLTSGSVKG